MGVTCGVAVCSPYNDLVSFTRQRYLFTFEIMAYKASEKRYDNMQYNRCGHSGIKLPAISLGLWHNFGNVDDYKKARKIVRTAFDHGITHFDRTIMVRRQVKPKKFLEKS